MKVYNCWRCGAPVPVDELEDDRRTLDGTRAYHSDCYALEQADRDRQKSDYLALKAEVMFERALHIMERQPKLNINNYYDEVQAVHEIVQADPLKFQSSDEMMVAIELVHRRIRAKPQFQIGRRRVDFLLPHLYVVLEVDGTLHKFKIKKDSQRDIEIMDALHKEGGNWEIVRVPTDLIEQNLRALVPAIKAVYNKRQKLRRENGGFIPPYWSQTSREQQLIVLDGVDDDTKKNLYPYMDNSKDEL